MLESLAPHLLSKFTGALVPTYLVNGARTVLVDRVLRDSLAEAMRGHGEQDEVTRPDMLWNMTPT